jgi:hypothetical protein
MVRRILLGSPFEAGVRLIILGGQGGEFAVRPVAGVVEPRVRLLIEFGPSDRIPPLAAVLEAQQTKADSRQAGPDPPPAPRIVQLRPEESEHDECERPQDGDDGNRANAVDVHRLELGWVFGRAAPPLHTQRLSGRMKVVRAPEG